MARPYVSTSLGAEGLEAVPERDLLVANTPRDFAEAVLRILREPALGARLGQAGRRLAEHRYSWQASSLELEKLFRRAIAAQGERG